MSLLEKSLPIKKILDPPLTGWELLYQYTAGLMCLDFYRLLRLNLLGLSVVTTHTTEYCGLADGAVSSPGPGPGMLHYRRAVTQIGSPEGHC